MTVRKRGSGDRVLDNIMVAVGLLTLPAIMADVAVVGSVASDCGHPLDENDVDARPHLLREDR